MARTTVLLWSIVVVELAVIGWMYASRPALPSPPLPRLELLDVVTADQLKSQRAACKNKDDFRRLGEQYFAYGFFPEAVACYETARALAPSNAQIHKELAFCLSHAGRPAESNKRYQQAIELGADKTSTSYFIGRNYLRLEQVDQARTAFTVAQDSPAARLELEKLSYRLGDPASKDSNVARLNQAYPYTTAVLYLRAKWAERQNKPQQAADYLDQADRATERLPNPFDEESKRVVQAYESTGLERRRVSTRETRATDYAAAESATKRILDVQWFHDEMDYLADLTLERGQIEESLRMQLEVIAKDGPSFDRCWRLGDAYARANRPQDAEKQWLTAIQMGQGQSPDLAELHHGLSQFYESLNRVSEAGQQKALGLRWAGVHEFQSGNMGAAKSLLRKSTEADPADPQSWFYYAESLRLSGESVQAELAYQRCLELAPNHGRALAQQKLLLSPSP